MPRTKQVATVTAPEPTPSQSDKMREVVRARWNAVRERHANYMLPFHEESIEDAMRYLEELRKVCEEGARIMNGRINDSKNPKVCSGPGCKKSCEDRIDGRGQAHPGYVSVKYIRDPSTPGVGRNLFFCSELCDQKFARQHNGAMGGTQ